MSLNSVRSEDMPSSIEVLENVAAREAKSAEKRRWVTIFVVLSLAIVFLLVVRQKSALQLFLLPCVFVVAWNLRLFRERIPKAVFGLAICGVLIGAVGQFSFVGLARGAFLVAGGRQWDLNQETKIYRDRMKRALGPSHKALLGMHTGSISTHDDARKLLAEHPKLGGVIWGSARWLNITLRGASPLALSEFPDGSVARGVLARNRVSDLRIVRGVSFVGLSNGTEDATVHFVASLIPLWRDFAAVARTEGDSDDFEVSIQALARMQARWSSRAHLALPMWISGTRHLVRALESQTIEGADLECAIRDLELAERQFRPKDNQELSAAVHNNLAIAFLIKSGVVADQREMRKAAKKQLSAAILASKKRKDHNVAAIVANRDALANARRGSHGKRR